jgi:hypothetical protein
VAALTIRNSRNSSQQRPLLRRVIHCCKTTPATALQQLPRNKAQQPATPFATRLQQPATVGQNHPATAATALYRVAKLLRPLARIPNQPTQTALPAALTLRLRAVPR